MKAFITGITGQDGSYLAELLLEKGYDVHGLIRRSSSVNTSRIDHIFDRLKLHYGDLTDGSGLARVLTETAPDEVYNLGAMSHVKVSFECPEYSVDVGATGTIRLLEAIRQTGLVNHVRYYQASSSEMFGGVDCPATGYTETSPFHPRSPYGCAKVFSYWQTVNYREAYGMHASNGILFNHESPRRGQTFVTRKITRGLARISAGMADELVLGNLDAMRDWGHAKDYVRAMWLMLQQPEPSDYVVATGLSQSVRDFLDVAARHFDIDWREVVRIDPRYYRPAEVRVLLGNPRKARMQLQWEPRLSFGDLVREMCDHDKDLT